MLSLTLTHSLPSSPVTLLSTEQLAKALCFTGPTSRFRAWCRELGITPVPGRRDVYDMHLVRRRLDEAQGLLAAPAPAAPTADKSLTQKYLESRRAA